MDSIEMRKAEMIIDLLKKEIEFLRRALADANIDSDSNHNASVADAFRKASKQILEHH